MSTYHTLQTHNVMKGLAEQWQAGKLCDVELNVEGKKISAHKNILAASSPYFHSLFLGDFKESNWSEISILGFTHTAMRVILNAIYTNKLELTNGTVGEILAAADFLQISGISELCEKHMLRNLSCETCFQFLKLFETFNLGVGSTVANDFIVGHFTSLSTNKEFLEISKEALCSYIDNDMLSSESEIEIFRTAQTWIEHDRGRWKSAPEIMRSVRLSRIPLEILKGELRLIPFMGEIQECMDLLFEAMKYQHNIYSQPIYNGPINKPRGEPSFFVIEGGKLDYDQEAEDFKFSILDHKTKMWYVYMKDLSMFPVVKSMSTTFACDSVSVVTCGNFLFLFGVENTAFSPVTMRYDATMEKWIRLKPVPDQATVGSSVVRVGDVIIMAGGMYVEKDSTSKILYDKFTKNVHKYHIASNTWSAGTDLPEPLVFAGSCEWKEMMYVSGGEVSQGDRSITTDQVWAYDVNSDNWVPKPKMPYPMRSPCLAAFNDTLYAFGSAHQDGVSILRLENWTWHPLGNANLSLENVDYITHEGTVYIIDKDWDRDEDKMMILQPDGRITECDKEFDFTNFRVEACALLTMK